MDIPAPSYVGVDEVPPADRVLEVPIREELRYPRIEITPSRQMIGIGSHITETEGRIRRQLPLNGQVVLEARGNTQIHINGFWAWYPGFPSAGRKAKRK